MNKQSITFSASEQTLEKLTGSEQFAGNTVSYVEATFTLGTNWAGFDSVSAVWKSQYYEIATVLDAYGKCDVPAEVMYYKSKVFVNLVGVTVSGDEVTDRLTTYPILAFTIDSEAIIEGTETTDITPSQFDQFVSQVSDDASAAAASAAAAAASAASLTVDSALSNSSTNPVQNKVINGAITDLKEDLDLAIDTITTWDPVTLTLESGYYRNDTGVFVSDTSRRTCKMSVTEGEEYSITTHISTTAISGIVYFDSSNSVVGHLLDGTGTAQDIVNYEFTIPSGVASMAVQTASYRTLSLLKHNEEKEFAGYTKAEINSFGISKYGVRWDIDDNDDLGERVFAAAGLSATIGVGATNGSSDFDNIYPWSEMKRCNIQQNENGASIVTFEGESGFSLTGSNGDVFVRIPKFYYERYIENGYEYRVISSTGQNVHPAFIENGVELDEIFVSAFEGYVSNNKLHSVGGVIPSNNIIPQTFLDYAQNNGSNYSLYDLRCVDAIWTLMAIEYGCRNTNGILGYGLSDFEQPTSGSRRQITSAALNTNTVRTAIWSSAAKGFMPVGSNITICDTDQTNILTQAKITGCVDSGEYTDWTFDGPAINVTTSCFIGTAPFNTNWCETAPSGNLTWHTGRSSWISGSADVPITRNAIRYRWIENIFGNIWCFLPDVTFHNLQMYMCKSMADYEMFKHTGEYKPVSALFTEQMDNGSKADSLNVNYWITELNHDIFNDVNFGRSFAQNLTSKKAFGGYYYMRGASTVIIANGGGFDHLYRCNMMTNRAMIQADQRWYLYGARLIYKNIS